MLGASITELSGTDTMSNFPTSYNATINSLNDNKIEISTTTLPLLTGIGTIIIGTWNADVLTVSYGGTGTTSPTLYRVMIGDGANGFTVASSTGTSGQFLTSGGEGAYPTWSTSVIDEAGIYTWTGLHTWANIVTFSNTFTANATSTFTGNILSNTDLVAMKASTSITGWAKPQPVYIASSTNPEAGGVLLVDANATSTLGFIGFAVTSASLGETVYVQTDGIVPGFTGLSKGSKYYVQDTIGTIGMAVGTYEVLVGTAVSITEILIEKGTWEYMGKLVGSSVTVAPTTRFIIGFYVATGNSGATQCVMTLARYGITGGACEAEDGGTEGRIYSSWNTSTNVVETGTAGVSLTSASIYMYR